jgi:hypothetical protein
MIGVLRMVEMRYVSLDSMYPSIHARFPSIPKTGVLSLPQHRGPSGCNARVTYSEMDPTCKEAP